jgi:hypothetical protein
MITPDHVRNLMAGGDVVLVWMDGGGAVVVEIAGCCSIDGWVVAVPQELEPPNEPEQQWYEQIAAELSDRCAMYATLHS